MRDARVMSLLLVLLFGCSDSAKHPQPSRNTVRYRLPLRDNPVSSSDAAHCFVGCQSSTTPVQYVECLSACPGFEKTPGATCGSTDVPPESACLTVRKVPVSRELPPGLVVLTIVGEMALVVGAASLCSISANQCGLIVPPK